MLSDSQFEVEWKQIFEELDLINLRNYYIIAGDLNARHTTWGNSYNNNKGVHLNRWQTNNNMLYRAKIYQTDAPTYSAANSYLDLAIIDMRLNVKTNSTGKIPTHTYESDHKAIEIQIETMETDNISYNTNQQRYSFINTNWDIWKLQMDKIYQKQLRRTKQTHITPNDRNLTNLEIEEGITKITEIIQNNLKLNVPKCRRRNNMECFTNNIIEKLYKHKSNILTIIKKCKRAGINNYQKVNTLKAEIKRTNELIKQNIKLQINKYWKNKLEAIKPGAKMFNNLKPFKGRDVNREISMLEIDENEAKSITNLNMDWNKMPKTANMYYSYNVQDNLNIIGHFIEKQSYTNPMLGKKKHEAIITQKVQKIKQQHRYEMANKISKCTFNATNKADDQQDADQKYFVTIEELKILLASTNRKKSYGTDKIPSIILKHLPESIIKEICIIFNNLLNNRTFPKCWKQARIFPIKKKGKNPAKPINYRPISLLSNLSKMFEIVIYNKIYNHAVRNNLIPDNQFGFRHNHTTTHAIANLTSHICSKLNQKISTGAVFLDMEKAFESVWLDGLIFKMTKMNFDMDTINILLDMLYNREFAITNGVHTSSRIFNVQNGLQQGSITAPILFNLYTRDLIDSEKINTNRIHTIAYADDIVIFSSDTKIRSIQEKIQSAVNFTTNFLHTWRIKINESKCETVLFRRPYSLANNDTRKNRNNLKIQINNTLIEQKPIVKYLGINIDQFCYLTKHINIQLIKAKNAFCLNKAIFYSRFIDPEVKRICYQTLIRPIITYGCPIWFNCNL